MTNAPDTNDGGDRAPGRSAVTHNLTRREIDDQVWERLGEKLLASGVVDRDWWHRASLARKERAVTHNLTRIAAELAGLAIRLRAAGRLADAVTIETVAQSLARDVADREEFRERARQSSHDMPDESSGV